MRPRQFASDTQAGICPEALAAWHEANQGHASAYGDDPWTARAVQHLKEFFETDCVAYFVPSGTAANALALASLCQSYHSVLCHADAHIQTDECGAPEYAAGGIKLVPFPGRDGKLDADIIRQAALGRGDVHSHKPGVLSLTQATEAGTLYSVEELRALTAAARERGLRVHLDGARFANALATLQVAPRCLTWEAGVDALSFGGSKNGLGLGEIVVFFDRRLAEGFEYRRKQAGHLLSKMRFLSAPWAVALETGVWRRNAEHANRMARHLEQALRVLDVPIVYPVQANAVFVRLSSAWTHALHQRGWHFYTIANGERLMCSWDTQPEDIDAFVTDLRVVMAET